MHSKIFQITRTRVDKDNYLNCPFNLPSKFVFLSVTAGNRARFAEIWDYAEYAEDVLDYLVQYEREQRFRVRKK